MPTMLSEIVQAMVRLLEVKDLSTAAHTWRVVLYTRTLAEDAGLPIETITRLTTAAALHDIGKLDIPFAILQKPGKLTDDEFEVMKTHTTHGHEHVRAMGEDDPIIVGLVRHHHERFDGKGYPDRLAGDQIPRVARYFAVVDSFDAMTSIRPYRSTIGPEAAEAAIAELKAGRGTRYDPDAVDRFDALYSRGSLDWIREHFNDARPVPDYEQLRRVAEFAKASGRI
ncbi:MAG: HD domain-containing protein [Phycisphaerales bacterium]|nr:HD domain-containing protein [Phycisphaerales bacterium]